VDDEHLALRLPQQKSLKHNTLADQLQRHRIISSSQTLLEEALPWSSVQRAFASHAA